MYRCETPTGAIIHTDTPAQLKKCMVMSMDAPLNPQPLKHSRETSRRPSTLKEQTLVEEDNRSTHEFTFSDEKHDSYVSQHKDTVIVPVIPYGGSLLVTVRLNQTRTAQLILDTGADHDCTFP